ncbi:hypothetical protein DFH06DRAFT_693443 [Mycena polygramma]|nr:hypothetical protein DFH06DRAFT_693443 [Mycena polygramma]
MFDFGYPNLPQFRFVIIRDDNLYRLALSRGQYGFHRPERTMADFRPTIAKDQPKLLPNGHPCLWLEPRDTSAPLEQVLDNLLAAQPRGPVALTGRKKRIPKENASGEYDAGYEEAVEVMLLLNEEELAHCCYYCGSAEEFYGDQHDVRYVKIGGQGYSSTYGCPECLAKSLFGRALTRMSRRKASKW